MDIGFLYTTLIDYDPTFSYIIARRGSGNWNYQVPIDTDRGYWPVGRPMLAVHANKLFAFISEEDPVSGDSYVAAYRSTNGKTWTRLLNGATSTELGGEVLSQGYHSSGDTLVLTVNDDPDTAGTPALLRSSDLGDSWAYKAVPTLDSLLDIAGVWSVRSSLLSSTGTLYIVGETTSSQKVEYVPTSDLGDSYGAAYTLADFVVADTLINAAMAAQDGDHLFVAVDVRSGYGAGHPVHEVHLAYSHNGGSTWTTVSNLSPNVFYAPSSEFSTACLYSLVFSAGRLYAYVKDGATLYEMYTTQHTTGNPTWSTPRAQAWSGGPTERHGGSIIAREGYLSGDTYERPAGTLIREESSWSTELLPFSKTASIIVL